jgi:hypothetical protein
MVTPDDNPGRPERKRLPCDPKRRKDWIEAAAFAPRTPDEPRVGYFRVRVVPRGPWCPARIWAYRPRVAGTDHLAAHILGTPCDVFDVWLSGREIDETEYQQLMASPPAAPMEPVSRRKEQPNGH